IKHLRVYGVGHSMARNLQSMKMLKKLYLDFIHDEINEEEFYLQARARRNIDRYYQRQLLPLNKHLTPARIKILKKHYAELKRKKLLENNNFDSNPSAEMVLKPSLSGEQSVNAKCNDV